jgi:hypothetical protein
MGDKGDNLYRLDPADIFKVLNQVGEGEKIHYEFHDDDKGQSLLL